MYSYIDSKLGENDTNGVLELCINANYSELGLLLGKISKKTDRTHFSLMSKLWEQLTQPQPQIQSQLEPKKSEDENFMDSFLMKGNVKFIKPEDIPSRNLKEYHFSNEKIEVIDEENENETENKTENEFEVIENIVPKINRTETKFIPKFIPKSKTVKILCNWLSPKGIADLWNKMSQGNYTWNNIQLVWGEKADYYVVVNCPPINESPELNKTILFQMEPRMAQHPQFWGDWANPPDELFLKSCKHKNSYNNCEWHLSKTYNELKTNPIHKNPELSTVISTVLSDKYQDPGQIKRIDFTKFLEKKMTVHVFGDNKWGYDNFKGSLPYHCKDNGLFPYKYHFNCENNSEYNYFTEKVVDAILSECLCFYSGCFNLKEYLPEEAFVYLEL